MTTDLGSVRIIRVFVSSPGDVEAERDLLEEVIATINRTDGHAAGFRLELFRWEENVTPQIGPKPQQVVDNQTPAYDIYLGILKHRFGTPTDGYGSGTEQEFNDAMERWGKTGSPWILFYFCDEPVNPNLLDWEQFARVREFRSSLEQRGQGLYATYTSVRGSADSFFELVGEHARNIARGVLEAAADTSEAVITPSRTSSRKTLLWVEDDPFMRQRIAAILEDEGYAVLPAADAESAVEVFTANQNDIDLAILDVIMPGGETFRDAETKGGFATGVSLGRWLLKRKPELPLVAFSISTEHEAIEWFVKHGVAYVEKSYDGGNLVETLRSVFADAQTGRTDDLHESLVEPPATSGPLSVGSKLDRYEIRKTLAHEGEGEMYLAWDEQLQREVAIKLPRMTEFSSPSASQRFIDEARTAAKLKHPAIVSIFDIGRSNDGSLYIVMEYAAGASLRELLAAGKPSFERATELLAPIAEALRVAHSAGLIHGGVNPSNILLDSQGKSRLANLGLVNREYSRRDGAEADVASIAYMAPEQLQGEAQELDGRADVWSLGVVLYEMLAGRIPFRGESLEQLVDEILHREPQQTRAIDPSIPESLERIVLECLRKRKEERYATPREFWSDLNHQSTATDHCDVGASDHVAPWSQQPATVDWQVALEAVSSREILLELTDKTFEEVPKLLELMRAAIATGDATEGRRVAHVLKGTLGLFGAIPAIEAAECMERIFRGERGGAQDSLADAERLFPEFTAEMERALRALAAENPWSRDGEAASPDSEYR